MSKQKSGKELHYEARKAILKYLDEISTKDSTRTKFTGTETEYDISDVLSDYGCAKRQIFFDALSELEEEGFVTASSSLDNLPIHGLKLTPKGLKRPRNPIEEWKEEGLKAAIAAFMTTVGRYLLKKYDHQ
ncbi:hypothetical protein PTW35_08405 [Photobacterium sp. DA100]|uniref:hypothetical protein n=1 Tax=Photobacterium sp. DA100 TaxID=3027472 RepID=UPI0024791961|nr:hypothetical protein [Photobacterium sp. DA100]WEM43785.1 hypothetical protein PTW35_08405 [Photobacterium sp. DA100]